MTERRHPDDKKSKRQAEEREARTRLERMGSSAQNRLNTIINLLKSLDIPFERIMNGNVLVLDAHDAPEVDSFLLAGANSIDVCQDLDQISDTPDHGSLTSERRIVNEVLTQRENDTRVTVHRKPLYTAIDTLSKEKNILR